MKISRAFFCFLVILATACKSGNDDAAHVKGNPPAEGFHLAASDPAAVELADSVMSAMGGRAAWESINFISWTDDGRNFVWDKKNDRARLEVPAEQAVFLLNLSARTGTVRVANREISQPDSLKDVVNNALEKWKESSYALLMPFLLKDTGVTLKYLGEETLEAGVKCNVLEVNRDEDAAKKRLQVYVDLADNLVKQCTQFSKGSPDSIDYVHTWDNYKLYDRVLISTDRSDGHGPKNVKVDKELADALFIQF